MMMFVGAVCYAQTPTPHPHALDIGVYDPVTLSSPEIELVGTWAIESSSVIEYLQSRSAGATLTFYVTDNADYIMWQSNTNTTTSDYTVCIDGIDCESFSHHDSQWLMSGMSLNNTNSEIKFTADNNDRNRYDLLIIGGSKSSSVSGTTPEPQPTPAYIIAGTVSGTDGDIDTEFHYLMTAGDVSIINALIFLFLSFWAVILILLVFKPHVR